GAANVALGIASALFKRERTGEPSVVEISLLSTAMWILSADITLSFAPGYDARMAASNVTMQPLMRTYRCADGKWLMLMLLDPARSWPGLCERLGHPELTDDPRFSSVALRAQNGVELYDLLSTIFATRPTRAWGEAFAGWDAPWEYIQTVTDVAQDP